MQTLGFDLILLGAPASGKDTQALLLEKKYKLRPIESGKYFRQRAAENSAMGRHLKQTFGKGHPAPVKMMKEFIINQIKLSHKNSDLLFVGNPRLKPEAQFLTKLLKAHNRNFLVIGITLPSAEIKKRSLKRMRDDQDWKYVDNRIKMHKVQVNKTLNYYKKLGKLQTVNGNQSVQAVAQKINKIIYDYQRQQANSRPQTKRTNSSPRFKLGRK